MHWQSGYRLWNEFLRNRDGNYAIVFALVLTTLLVAAGTGIDIVASVSTRNEMQNALDSAVLAAASNGETLDEDYAKKFFLSNIRNATMSSDSDSGGAIVVTSLDFSTDADGDIVGTAQIKQKTNLMAIAGISAINMNIYAKAAGSSETKIETATYKIKSAQGAYDKDIYFFTRDSDGKIVSEDLILQYDYAYSRRGGYKYYTPAKTSDVKINVGDYASYGYKMVVYEDNTYTGKHTNPKEYYSDDEDASKWTKVEGECTDSGGATNYWEDGGDSNFLDFVFTTTCTEGSSGATSVRLVE